MSYKVEDEFQLKSEEINEHLMEQVQNFKQFVEGTSEILKPMPSSPDFEKIVRRVNSFRNSTSIYSSVEFTSPIVEIQALINGETYTVGKYHSEVTYKNPYSPEYDIITDHTYNCTYGTPLCISTNLSNQDNHDWNGFMKSMKERLSLLENAVTGTKPAYVEKIEADNARWEADYRSWRAR